MRSSLPLLAVSLLLLTGCQGVSSASESAAAAPIMVKFAPYNFLDGGWRDMGEEWLAAHADDLDEFYAGKGVSAYGTWNSRTTLALPNHSVDLHCLRYEGMEPYAHDRSFQSKGICIVAKATIDTAGEFGQKNFLSANTNFYDISKWTFDEIVAVGSEEAYDCYKEELKLDRKHKTVTLLRTTIPGGNCLVEPDKEPLLLTLGCPPATWPQKDETHDVNGKPFTQYCLPDFDKMTEEQRDAYTAH